MQINLIGGILLVIAIGFSSLAESKEYRVTSFGGIGAGGVPAPSSHLILGCTNNNIYFSIHWNTIIGTVGKYKRHLIHLGALNDVHYLFKVLPDKTSTGIIDSDLEAKAIIKLIFENSKKNDIPLEVFPDDRDKGTGEWESRFFSAKEFLDSTVMVAKECMWDIGKEITEKVRAVNPGEPYEGE